MRKISQKTIKITINSIIAFFMATMIVLSGIGIYFANKITTKITVNPLEWATDVFDGEYDSTKGENFYTSGNDYANRGDMTYTIDCVDSFLYFVSIVNDEDIAGRYNYFLGYTVYLNKNLDFDGYAIDSIGVLGEGGIPTFQGTFDGSYYTISNATINGNGLFAYTRNATIKNIGLYNCTINSGAEYTGGILGYAENPTVSGVYIFNGEVKSSADNCTTAGIIGQAYITKAYTSNIIANSFVNARLMGKQHAGLIGSLIDTQSNDQTPTEQATQESADQDEPDPAYEYNLVIAYSYYTNASSLYINKSARITIESETVLSNPTKGVFVSWPTYKSEYDLSFDWCDYTYRENSTNRNFNLPIQTGFNKVFMKGSFYENTVYNETTGEFENVESFSGTFETMNQGETAQINVVVERLYIDEPAVIKANSVVEIYSAVETTLLRGENLTDAMILVGENVKLALGDAESEKIIIDGNREYVETNNLKSSAALVFVDSYGANIENTTICNNINNMEGNGGLIAILDKEEANKVQTVRNHLSNLQSTQQIYPLSSVVTVTSATYTLNAEDTLSGGSASYGGGIYATNGTIVVYGTISNNTASRYGGGIYATGSTTKLTIENVAKVINNQATSTSSSYGFGGGIYICDATIEISGEISSNAASRYGGGIYAYGSSSNIVQLTAFSSTQITENKSSSSGGGIYLDNVSAIISCTISKNSSEGIYAKGSLTQVTLKDSCIISENTNSGVIITGVSKELVVESGCQISNNGGTGIGYSSNSGSAIIAGEISNNSSTGINANNCTISITGNVIGNGNHGISLYSCVATISGIISNNSSANFGGGIYASDSQLTIESEAQITDNKTTTTTISSSYGGGGIYVSNCTTMIAGEVSSNISTNSGGGIYASGNSANQLIIEKTAQIHANEAKYGGGIYTSNTSTIACTISNNTASEYGGGIYVYSNTTTISGIISSNSATENGGGIYVAENTSNISQLVIETTSQIINNKTTTTASSSSNGQGGGIYIENGIATISGLISENTATNRGGGIYAYGSSMQLTIEITAQIKSNSIINKSTTHGGAGIYLFSSPASIAGTISNNTAYTGGGIYASGSDTQLTIESTAQIVNNTASSGGGGGIYMNDNATATIFGTINENSSYYGAGIYSTGNNTIITIENSAIITTNKSSGYGGGIYANDGSLLTLAGTLSNNTASQYGGGIYLLNSKLTIAGIVSENSAVNRGGGIYASESQLIIESTAQINNNKTTTTNSSNSYGGGIYLSNGSATIAGILSNNSVTYRGGGIYASGSNTQLIIETSAQINNNSTTTASTTYGNGGGIYASGIKSITIAGTVSGNTSSYYGGGIYAQSTQLTIESTANVTNNQASYGGGAYVYYGTANILGIVSNNITTSSGAGIYAYGSSSNQVQLTIESTAQIVNNTASSGPGGGIYMNNVITFIYGNILENSANRGGGIYSLNSQITIEKVSQIVNNTSSDLGGGIYVAGGTAIIYGIVSGNTTYNRGGGIYASSSNTQLIIETSAQINNNKTTNTSSSYSEGGGIYAYGIKSITISGTVSGNSATSGGGVYTTATATISGTISNNTASQYGGGIYNSNITTISGTISGNIATYSGGGVYVSGSRAQVIVESTAQIISNEAKNTSSSYGGGGIYIQGVLATISGEVSNNTATYYGGGIYAKGNTSSLIQLTIESSAKVNNNSITSTSYSSHGGGGIYVSYGTTLIDGIVSNNTSSENGGGILASSGTLTVSGLISENTAIYNGGGIYSSYTQLTINSTSQIINNETTGTSYKSYGGAGIYISGGTALIDGNISNNMTAKYGGGISIDSGTINITGAISGNSASEGGGIYTRYEPILTIENSCQVIDNEATASYSRGGGLYLSGGTISIAGTISNNTAVGGGGIFATNDTTQLTIEDSCQIINNEATSSSNSGRGGGIYLYYGPNATILGTVSQNITNYGGGGIAIENASATISGTITNNTATLGGGVYASGNNDTLLTIEDLGQIINNIATSSGGGIYVRSGTTTISGIISENSAVNSGGGIYAYGQTSAQLTIESTAQIINNETTTTNTSTSYGGGGLYVSSYGTINIFGTISSNSSTYGGGIYRDRGTINSISSNCIFNNTASVLGNNTYGCGYLSITYRKSSSASNSQKIYNLDKGIIADTISENFYLDGWSDSSTSLDSVLHGGEEYLYESTSTNNTSLTLYAVYYRNYIFKYGLNLENQEIVKEKYKYNVSTTTEYEFEPPILDKYIFVNWSTETIGASVNGSIAILTNKEGIFTANYQLGESTLTILLNGGIYDDQVNDLTITQEINSTYTLLIPTKIGYYFDEWTLTGSGSLENSIFTFGNQNSIIEANWISENYNVKFDANSGTLTGKASITMTYDSTAYSAISASVTINAPTGYTFDGWYTASTGGEKVYDASGNAVSGTYWNTSKQWIKDLGDNGASMTLYAHWTPITYSITYKDQGGANFSGTHESGYPTTHTYGTVTTLKSATKTGYALQGWYTTSDCSGSAITSLGATSYTANITLYAKWTPNRYKVIVDVNDEDYGRVNGETSLEIMVDYNSTISINNNVLTIGGQTITATPIAIEGYTTSFTSWTNASGTITEERTITANFDIEIIYYKVTINVNNSNYGSINDLSIVEVIVPYGTTFTTSDNILTIGSQTITAAPTNSNEQYTYEFENWSVENGTIIGARTITANFKQTIITYTVEININNAEFGTISQAFIENVPYGTTFSMNNGVLTINTQPSATIVTATPKTQTIQYTYSFKNWTNVAQEEITSGTIQGDVVLTANFEQHIRQYTVNIVVDEGYTSYGAVNPTSVVVDYGTNIVDNKTNILTIGSNTITATSTNENYTFDYWTIPNEEVQGNITITANFARLYDVSYRVIGATSTNEYSLDIMDKQNEIVETITKSMMDSEGSVKVQEGYKIKINANTNTSVSEKVYQLLYAYVDDELTAGSPVAENLMNISGATIVINSNREITLDFVEGYVVDTSSDSGIEALITANDPSNSSTIGNETIIAKNADITVTVPKTVEDNNYFYIGFTYTLDEEEYIIYSYSQSSKGFTYIGDYDGYKYSATNISPESITILREKTVEFDGTLLADIGFANLTFRSSQGYERKIILGSTDINWTIFSGVWEIEASDSTLLQEIKNKISVKYRAYIDDGKLYIEV